MKLWIIQNQLIVKKFVIAAALIIVQAASGIAQTLDATVQGQSVAENDSATEASKQAANPLASVWLMQFQQNNTWLGMPANGGNRSQGNLQFQPLMSVKLTDDWNLITRPVLQLFNNTPFQDQGGRSNQGDRFRRHSPCTCFIAGPSFSR